MSVAAVSHFESQIHFSLNDQGNLSVNIETERLYIRSVEASEAEYDRYAALFGSKKVMEKFATGETKSREDLVKRINDVWVKRWRARDPYAGLSIFKKDTGEFLGHVVLGHSEPGVAEVAYVLDSPYWKNGYGSEAVAAVINDYAPATVREGYLLDGKPLEKIVATARPDNPASVRILEKVGMKYSGSEIKFNALRHHYSLSLNQNHRVARSWCTIF